MRTFLPIIAMLAAALSFALLPDPAIAGNHKDKGKPAHADKQNGNGKGKGKGKGRGAEARKHRGPPPWAPAHGYRYKNGEKYSSSLDDYKPPFSLDLGTCNRQKIATAIGASAGALAGSTIGKGDGKKLAILGGTILGAIVGATIGRKMDEIDQACVSQTLEHAEDGDTVRWKSAEGTEFEVTPLRTIPSTEGQHCREYRTTSSDDRSSRQETSVSCRDDEGLWRMLGQ